MDAVTLQRKHWHDACEMPTSESKSGLITQTEQAKEEGEEKGADLDAQLLSKLCSIPGDVSARLRSDNLANPHATRARCMCHVCWTFAGSASLQNRSHLRLCSVLAEDSRGNYMFLVFQLSRMDCMGGQELLQQDTSLVQAYEPSRPEQDLGLVTRLARVFLSLNQQSLVLAVREAVHPSSRTRAC